MFDLELKTNGNCLLCRGTHAPGREELCRETLDLALKFADEYRGGVGDRYNFDVQISVRGSKVVFVGHPTKKPKLPKRIAVC